MKQKLELKCDKHFILPKLKVKLKIRGFLWRYSEMLISTGSSWRRSWRCCWRWCWWGRPSSGWRSAGWWSFSSSGDLFSLFLIGQTVKRTIYVTSEKWHKLTSKWGLLTICCSVVEMGNCLTQRGQNINFGQIVWETQNFFAQLKKNIPKISNSYHFENEGKFDLAKLVHFASAGEMDINWLHVTIQMTAVLPTRAVMIMMVKATSQKSPRDQDISLLGGELGQVTVEAINWERNSCQEIRWRK